MAGAFDDADKRSEFRDELGVLQEDLRNYNRLLADIAGVEDLTDLEGPAGEGVTMYSTPRHRVFIGFHHQDQAYKEWFVSNDGERHRRRIGR